jgi:hypothetical protein
MPKPEFTFRYKVRNWPEYNRALVRRGRLTLWFDQSAVGAWRDTTRSNEPGRPKVYANAAIECALILKSVFHLSLRATQGFLESVVTLMSLELPVPDYSTMSRRQAGLAVSMPPASRSSAHHIVVDSTGLKVYGAGEWHAGKYRRAGRRVWRKLTWASTKPPGRSLPLMSPRVAFIQPAATDLALADCRYHRAGLWRQGLRYSCSIRGGIGLRCCGNHRAATERENE